MHLKEYFYFNFSGSNPVMNQEEEFNCSATKELSPTLVQQEAMCFQV